MNELIKELETVLLSQYGFSQTDLEKIGEACTCAADYLAELEEAVAFYNEEESQEFDSLD
jgi:hypothetical protein